MRDIHNIRDRIDDTGHLFYRELIGGLALPPFVVPSVGGADSSLGERVARPSSPSQQKLNDPIEDFEVIPPYYLCKK